MANDPVNLRPVMPITRGDGDRLDVGILELAFGNIHAATPLRAGAHLGGLIAAFQGADQRKSHEGRPDCGQEAGVRHHLRVSPPA